MRRRRREAAVSLFAFQDVLAAVVGVLFFVVLLAALEAVSEPAHPREEADLAALEREAAALRAEAETLRRGLAARARAEASSAGSSAELADEAAALERTLAALEARRATSARDERGARGAHAAGERELDELAARAAALAEEEERLRRELAQGGGARVRYLLDPAPGAPAPWLVELAAAAITVGPDDGSAPPRRFDDAPPGAARERFLAWADRRDPGREYFVLLIEPGALPWHDELRAALEARGFRIGTDLLPTSWSPFE